MGVPQDRKYLESHEWHLVDSNFVTIGITQFAADQLNDITYVELPAVGTEVAEGKAFGEIESVKATSELSTAVSGKVIEINANLEDQPELVNNDPYGDGWMIKVEAGNLGGIEKLLSAAEYDEKFSE